MRDCTQLAETAYRLLAVLAAARTERRADTSDAVMAFALWHVRKRRRRLPSALASHVSGDRDPISTLLAGAERVFRHAGSVQGTTSLLHSLYTQHMGCCLDGLAL